MAVGDFPDPQEGPEDAKEGKSGQHQHRLAIERAVADKIHRVQHDREYWRFQPDNELQRQGQELRGLKAQNAALAARLVGLEEAVPIPPRWQVAKTRLRSGTYDLVLGAGFRRPCAGNQILRL